MEGGYKILQPVLYNSNIGQSCISDGKYVHIFCKNDQNIFDIGTFCYFTLENQNFLTATSNLPQTRYNSSIIVNNRIYLFGGISDSLTISNNLFSLPCYKDHLSKEYFSERVSYYSEGYFGHSCAYNQDDDSLYFFGGARDSKKGTFATSNLLLKYDLYSSLWSIVPVTSSPSSRFLHSSIEKDKKIFIFGGIQIEESSDSSTDKNKRELNDLWIYSFETKSWKEIQTSKSIQSCIGYLKFEKDNLVIFGGGKKSKGKDIIENILDNKTRKNLKTSTNPFPFQIISNRNQVPLLAYFIEKGIFMFHIGGTNMDGLYKDIETIEIKYQMRNKTTPFDKLEKEFVKIASYMNSKDFISFYKTSKTIREKLSHVRIDTNEFNFNKQKSFLKKGLFNQDVFIHQPLPFISNLNLKNVADKIKNSDLKKFELLLKVIHARECEKLTDEAFIVFPELEEIYISNSKITNAFFDRKNSLRKVYLENCPKITIQPLLKLKEKGVKDIYVKNCPGIKNFEKEFKNVEKNITFTILGPRHSGKSVLLTHFEDICNNMKMDDLSKHEILYQSIIVGTKNVLKSCNDEHLKFKKTKSYLLKESLSSTLISNNYSDLWRELYPLILGFWRNEKQIIKIIDRVDEVHDGLFFQINKLKDYIPDKTVLTIEDFIYSKQSRANVYTYQGDYLNTKFSIQFISYIIYKKKILPDKKVDERFKFELTSKYVVYVISLTHYYVTTKNDILKDFRSTLNDLKELTSKYPNQKFILILNKKDLFEKQLEEHQDFNEFYPEFEKSGFKTPLEFIQNFFSNISSNVVKILTLNLISKSEVFKIINFLQDIEK